MKPYFLIFLTACGGEVRPREMLPESGVETSPEPIRTPRPQVSGDAGTSTDSGWVCQPCCLNYKQWNCVGGNASMTKECSDPGAPAICLPNDCVGQQCNF